tara:strand:+ start:132 stop:416 length:285 start_codon:yes stop_codon:yes gene_type:complete
MTNKKPKQLSLFSTKKINLDTKINKLDDAAVNKLLESFQMVSSKQLAQILSKPNDNSLRVARCENRGFSWYKHDGTVYYNLPEVMREIKVGINA